MKLLRRILFFSVVSFITMNVYALDQMAKEEMTPPPAEGALTINQLPPIYSANKETPKAPAEDEAEQDQ
jgi:hypothetical protein